MCLSIPGKIIKINKDTAIIDYNGEKRKANISLINCKVGDYVIVQQKFIIQKIDKKDAIKALKLFNNMAPEQYFLKYALPCSYVLVEQKRLSKEQQRNLENKLLNNESISREELEKSFPEAFRRINELALRSKKDPWSIEVIRKYWIEEHNKYIDKGEGMYSKFSNEFKEICKVHKAKVIEIKDNILTVSYDKKTRKVLSNLIPNVKLNKIVTIHQGYAIEILS